MIDLDEIIEKYEKGEDDKNKPTSEELGITENKFQKPVANLIKQLNMIEADLDWWMGDKTRHEMGVLQLGSTPPEGSASIEEVVDMLDFDYNTVMRNVKSKQGQDFSTIAKNIDPSKLREKLKSGNIPGAIKEAFSMFTFLKSKDPADKPYHIAKMLKDHGFDEVEIGTYFEADWLFDRLLKAEVAKSFENFFGEENLDRL